MAETVKSLGEIVSKLIDKLAGKRSDLKVTFKDLTLEVGMLAS